jgi:3-methyladenine DNA glycosylase AlkD
LNVSQIIDRLNSLGSEKMRAQHEKGGVTGPQFGVKMGDLRVIAKEAKLNTPLALELWNAGTFETRLLTCLIVKPKELTQDQLENLVRETDSPLLADWVNSYVVKAHPAKEEVRERWMADAHPMLARAGWSLTTERVTKTPEGLDLSALLKQIEAAMPQADPLVQWTMNFALGEIGIHFPAYRARAIAIGEKIGLYRDWPVAKGCVIPYVPVWVSEMVSRETG